MGIKTQFAVLKKFIKEKVKEFKNNPTIIAIKSRLAALKAYIKSQIAAMKKELPVIIGKIEKMVTEEATKLERGLKELVEKIKKSEEFLALKRKVEELKKFIKRIINKLKNNPTLQKITAKGKEIVKMTKEYTKQCIKLLKEELPKVINDIERMLTTIYKTSTEFIKKILGGLEKRFWSIIKAIQANKNYKLFKNIIRDAMLSFHANKNVTMRMYNDMKTAIAPYYKQVLVYLHEARNISTYYYKEFVQLSRNEYTTIVHIYQDLRNSTSFEDLQTKLVA